MKYFFIFGRHPLLSLAELKAYLEKEYSGEFEYGFADDHSACIVETGQEINIEKTITDLGGTVKIGIFKSLVVSPKSLVNERNNSNKEKLNRKIFDEIYDLITKIGKADGKFSFGISVYGTDEISIKHLGMDVKAALKEKGISARWVASKEKNLSSVVVSTNHLLDKGAEFIVVKSGDGSYIGKTAAVQPFRELSFRDYGRPTRDDYSGMLPPKLAKMMINLAGAKNNSAILDPFCGSGTILTEALLMGYENLIGADISEKAVNDTRSNIEWTIDNSKSTRLVIGKSKREIQSSKLKLYKSNIFDLGKVISNHTIDAIITEPYLGPQRGKHDINGTKRELEKLYSQAFRVFEKILMPSGKIVIVWPVLLKDERKIYLDKNIIGGFKIINALEGLSLLDIKKLKFCLSDRGGLIYSRPGQKVLREILMMKK